MPRFVSGCRSATAGTTARPWMSVYAVTASGFVFRECGIFNTTTTGFAAKMTRLTSAGTPGASLTSAEYDPTAPPAAATPFNSHTADAALGDDLGMRDSVGGAVGAGVKFSAAGRGIAVPAGAANGIGPIVATGTGQISDVYMVWDE